MVKEIERCEQNIKIEFIQEQRANYKDFKKKADEIEGVKLPKM